MNYKKFKKYYSVDKAENRWQGVMNFVILFLGLAILFGVGVYYLVLKNIDNQVLPKIETDQMRLESIENRVVDLEILMEQNNSSQNLN